MQKTAEADKKNTFDVGRLVNRRMTLNPNDLHTVYEVAGPGAESNEDDFVKAIISHSMQTA